jgi:hypothetical protein
VSRLWVGSQLYGAEREVWWAGVTDFMWGWKKDGKGTREILPLFVSGNKMQKNPPAAQCTMRTLCTPLKNDVAVPAACGNHQIRRTQ